MSRGKPIICNCVCDNPNIVQENINGIFFDPNNVKDMATKLSNICSKPKEILQIWGQESRKITEKLFSKESFVNKYIELI